jgi:integrase
VSLDLAIRNLQLPDGQVKNVGKVEGILRSHHGRIHEPRRANDHDETLEGDGRVVYLGSVPLDPTLRLFIESHLEINVKPGLEAWVFPQRNGARRSATTRWFAVSTQETAGRARLSRQLTFHDLRRTYGAMLVEAGVDIYTVSRLLGHSDVKITQEVYAPICGRFLAHEAAKLGRYLGPSLLPEVPRVPPLPEA